MAQFLSGEEALRKCARESKVSTVFAASSKGSKISMLQKTDGSTTWKLDNDPEEEECLSLFTTIDSFYLRLDTIDLAFGFRNAGDFMSNYVYYTIDRVEVSVYGGSTLTSSTFAADQSLLAANPLIVVAVDRRNSNPDNLEALLVDTETTMKQIDVNSPIEVSYTPSAFYSILGGNENAQSPVYSPKIATVNDTVDHYGVKFALFGLNAIPDGDRSLGIVSFIVRQYVTFYEQRVRVV